MEFGQWKTNGNGNVFPVEQYLLATKPLSIGALDSVSNVIGHISRSTRIMPGIFVTRVLTTVIFIGS